MTHQQQMLKSLADYANLNHPKQTSINNLLNNQALLVQQLSEIQVDWSLIASQLGMTRDKLYHWYTETYVRKNQLEKVLPQDRVLMKQLITQAIVDGNLSSQNFQAQLKIQVFADRPIHRSDFSMTYNNIVRAKDMQELMIYHNMQLPNQRQKRSGNNNNDIEDSYSSTSFSSTVSTESRRQNSIQKQNPTNDDVKTLNLDPVAVRTQINEQIQQQLRQQQINSQQFTEQLQKKKKIKEIEKENQEKQVQIENPNFQQKTQQEQADLKVVQNLELFENFDFFGSGSGTKSAVKSVSIVHQQIQNNQNQQQISQNQENKNLKFVINRDQIAPADQQENSEEVSL